MKAEPHTKAFRLPLPADVAMGFPVRRYPDAGAYLAHLQRLRQTSQDRFQFHTDRRCWTGDHDLYWLVVGDPARPAILVTSVLHAKNEWQGAHVVMRLVEKLLDPADSQRRFNDAFLSAYCLVAVPIVNAWGYFAAPEGVHHNNHAYAVLGIAGADWHDMTAYSRFSGVNLNRNFDCHWESFVDLPFSVRAYWNGRDYGQANYFMMPFRRHPDGREVYDPNGIGEGRVLRPDPEIYDGKGEAPFSEPETQLIRDLFRRYPVAGFMDLHVMNPWQQNSTDYISRHGNGAALAARVDDGIARVNARHAGLGIALPPTRHLVTEDYGGNAPYAVNWARNRMGVPAYDWETGTGLPEELWTDAYLEVIYRALGWMDSETRF